MMTLNWSILTVKGAENTPRGPDPLLLLLGYHIFYGSRLGAHDLIFIRKNVCAALKLEVNDPFIMQIRLSLDGLASRSCCYV